MKIFLTFFLVFFLTGCSSPIAPAILEQRQTNVVDSCYTVLEYNSNDKFTRIDNYLSKKIEEGILTKQSASILRKCLLRTTASEHWSYNE